MKTISLEIMFYGAFRKLGDAMTVDVESGTPVEQVKQALKNRLGGDHHALIDDSVLADDTDVLPGEHIFTQGGRLSILPPVCGG